MIQQLWSLVLIKALKIHDQIKTFISLVTLFIIVVTYKLALAICLYNDQTMSCYSCWPSNTLWKEFRMEIRNEALCALGKTSRTGLQILRYFQEVILWAWFLHLLIPRKVLKCFMVSLLLMTSSNLHGNSRILLQKKCASLHILLFHPNHIYTDFPSYLFGAVSQRYLKCCLLVYSSHFASNKT